MPVNISEVIDRERFTGLQAGVLLLTSMAVIVDGFDIQSLAFAAPVIIQEWGLTRAEFGPAAAAALGGMLVGAPLGGVLGDWIGRRLAMVFSAIYFGVATIATSYAGDLQQLIILRLVSGVGFGALLPNATALLAEWVPARYRSIAVSVMIMGVPIGGIVGAAVSSWLIPAYGWRAAFQLGGAVAIATAVILLIFLPESLRFLLQRPKRRALLTRLLQRAYGQNKFEGETFVMDTAAKVGLAELFTSRHFRVTFGLSLAFIANLLVFYGFSSWVPTILTSMGLPLDVSIRGALYFNLWSLPGALVAGLLVGLLGSRWGLLLVLGAAIAVTAGMAYLILGGAPTSTSVMLTLSAAGAAVAGLQAALYALAAAAYPTNCRSTGIGFVAGIGRLGAIVSAFAGGVVLSQMNGEALFFAILALVLLVAVLAVFIIDRHAPPTRKQA